MTTIIIYLMVAILFLGMGIGYWIGTLSQRALEAEKKAEIARLLKIQDGYKDFGINAPEIEDPL